MGKKENAVQNVILDYLRNTGWLAWRHNNTPVPIRCGRNVSGFRRFDQFNVGAPDIFAYRSEKLLGIECKTEKGVQSDEQKEWQARIKKAGGVYILARSLDDVMFHVKQL